jgi:hypothetical protein
LTVCIAELVGKDSWFLTMKIIKENMYSHGRVKISSLLKRLAQYSDWLRTKRQMGRSLSLGKKKSKTKKSSYSHNRL